MTDGSSTGSTGSEGGTESIGPSEVPEESVASESELSLSHQKAQRDGESEDDE